MKRQILALLIRGSLVRVQEGEQSLPSHPRKWVAFFIRITWRTSISRQGREVQEGELDITWGYTFKVLPFFLDLYSL